MSRFPKFVTIPMLISLMITQPAFAENYGLGRVATWEEIKAWNFDIRPDGTGLPDGRGTVAQGEEIWAEKCASCHGDFGEGLNRWTVVAGGLGTLASDGPVRTVGSYWPYLSTVWDYIYRAMPLNKSRTLEPDEVYALTAYIMSINDVVDENFELSKANFLEKRLPNEKNFFADPRPDTPGLKQKLPCMTNCKSDVKITNRAGTLDVTPDEKQEEN